MKKTIPFMFTILAIASIASTAVLGNTQTAYAGGSSGCVLDPAVVELVLAPGESSGVIHKTIDCGEDIDTVFPGINDCTNEGIDVSFENTFVDTDTGIWHGDETITNNQNPPQFGQFENCAVSFEVDSIFFGSDDQSQEIEVFTPEPPLVGGEFLPIDSAALVLAGLQTSAIWMLSVLAGVAGSAFGLLYIKSRRN